MGDRSELTRRALVKAGLATAGGLLLTGHAQAGGASVAEAAQVEPPASVHLTFPIRSGEYQTLSDNWHASRVGKLMTPNHRNSRTRRAHDGVDVFPASTASLPLVYAPFDGAVLAVCIFRGSRADYASSALEAPRQDYSTVVDGRTPRHGNYVWMKSTAADDSVGFEVEYAHLQDEQLIESLLQRLREANARGEYLPVSVADAVGRLGDSGNAAGTPQLHVELHLPGNDTFTCSICRPVKSGLTAISPYASLKEATTRP